jgi:hypothetical protein
MVVAPSFCPSFWRCVCRRSTSSRLALGGSDPGAVAAAVGGRRLDDDCFTS